MGLARAVDIDGRAVDQQRARGSKRRKVGPDTDDVTACRKHGDDGLCVGHGIGQPRGQRQSGILRGGAGIGGVLEPLQASPTIIEDHCFIGARSEVVEGVVVGHHSVIGMGVFIGKSTKIVDRETGEVMYGEVPAGSVVVAGSMPSKNGVNLYCAVIVKRVDARTRSKTSINELLRD